MKKNAANELINQNYSINQLAEEQLNSNDQWKRALNRDVSNPLES